MGTDNRLSAAGKVLAGARQINSHQAPPHKSFGFFFVTRDAAFGHAKMKL